VKDGGKKADRNIQLSLIVEKTCYKSCCLAVESRIMHFKWISENPFNEDIYSHSESVNYTDTRNDHNVPAKRCRFKVPFFNKCIDAVNFSGSSLKWKIFFKKNPKQPFQRSRGASPKFTGHVNNLWMAYGLLN